MGTNLYAPNGLSSCTEGLAAAPNYAQPQFLIKQGYGTNIAVGDMVKTGTGTYQGYVVLAAANSTGILGVFGGVLPYYDATQQAIVHGQVGAYPSGANPNADVPCVCTVDPFAEFVAQVQGGPWLSTWRGQNIGILAGTNGVPNIFGRSTLALDGTTVGLTNTLPFRIMRVWGVTGGPQDPANTNPWIVVRVNTSESLNPNGI